MTDRSAAPAYRLKLPCADEREFRDKFLQKYVSRGVFVPSESPRPVGTRLKLKLEIRGGTVLVSGDGMVTAVAQPGGAAKAGMTVRLTALHPEGIQFPLSPAGGASPTGQPATPVHRPPISPHPALTPPAIKRPTPPSPTAAAPAVTPSPKGFADDAELFDLGEATSVHAAPDEGVMATTDPGIPIPAELVHPEPPASPVPTPVPAGPVSGPPARPTSSPKGRRPLFLAAGGLAIALVAVGVGGVIASRTARASREQAARLDERLRLAETRLLEGRLAGAGGDSALDHLIEARAAAPGDPRVAARLKLLAEKFEQLGDRAMARRNLVEAAVHFQAAVTADPTRATARARLDEIEAGRKDAPPPR